MTELARDAVAANVAELMIRYSFDLEGYAIEQWVNQWLDRYPAEWLHSAVIEALYQGRYKAISVWQLLDLWWRRGQPLRHFNRDFERMVSGQTLQLLFPESASAQSLIAVSQPQLVSVANGNRSSKNGGQYWETRREPTKPATSTESASRSDLILPTQTIRPAQPASIQPFKPSEQFKLTLPGEIYRTRSNAQPPIQQFTPTPDLSDFHEKLKTMAQALVLANAHAAVIGETAAPDPLESPDPAADSLPEDSPPEESGQEPQ